MTQLFRNARIFDGSNAECAEGMQVLVADGRIQEVSDRPIAAPDARVIDVAGRTLMPRMIDAHVHAYASDVSVQKIEALGAGYRTADGDSRVSYTLLQMIDAGEITTEFVRVEYDVARGARGIRESGLPDEIAEFLETGGKVAWAGPATPQEDANVSSDPGDEAR